METEEDRVEKFNKALDNASVKRLVDSVKEKENDIKKMSTVIVVLIGIIFILVILGSNPKYDTPEWTGVSHQGL